MPRRLKRTVQGEDVTLEVLPWPERNQRFLDWLKHVHDNENGIIGLDVETTAIDEELGVFEPGAELRMVQFGSRRYAWCLDPSDEFWAPVIEATLAMRKLRFVSHTNYDPLWVAREYGIDLGAEHRSIDTLPMAALLWPGNTPKDLKSLTARLIDGGLQEAEQALSERFKELAPSEPTGKIRKDGTPGMRKLVGKKLKAWGFTNVPVDDPVFGLYAGLDAIYVRRLLDILDRLIRGKKMAPLSRREQHVMRLCNGITTRGHRVDPEWTGELLSEFERNYGEAERRLFDVFGFTPNSPKRGDWLEENGAVFYEKTPTGRPQITMPSAAKKGTLPELAMRYENDELLGPIFADLLTMGQHKNILTNLRIIARAARHDGYVHPIIRTQQAHTGRMSVTKPAMQTFKKNDPRLRGCFVARDGYVLVGADYDSQEIRIAAAYSRDPALLKIIWEGLNQHIVTAESLFGSAFVDKTSVMDPTSGKTYYDAAKVLDFAQQYGAWPRTIGDQLGMPRSKATDDRGVPKANPKAVKMWLAWRDTYAGLVEWTDRMAETRTVVNPWGRRIPSERGREYANGNYMIQSSGRDLLGDAMVRLAERGYGDALWLPIHDELVLEVPENEALEAATALEECMYAEIRGVQMTATANIVGTRWGAKE